MLNSYLGPFALSKFFFIIIDKGGISLLKHFERNPKIRLNLNCLAFTKPNKQKKKSKGFSTTWPDLFSNTFATVGKLERLLQSFFLKSLFAT